MFGLVVLGGWVLYTGVWSGSSKMECPSVDDLMMNEICLLINLVVVWELFDGA